MGIFLYATETTAVEQYWFDIDRSISRRLSSCCISYGMGFKRVHATWFSGDPEFVHGINFLPITSGSLYLGNTLTI